MLRFIRFLLPFLFVTLAFGQSAPTWTNAVSGVTTTWGGYLQTRYNTLTNQTLLWIPDNAGISTGYADSLWAFTANRATPSSSTMVKEGTTGQTSDCLISDPFTHSWTGNISGTGPSMRHTSGTIWWDGKRNRLWQILGVCNTTVPTNFPYLQAANPITSSTWNFKTTSHSPAVGIGVNGTGVWDSDDDVFFIFGSDSGSLTLTTWVYCDTSQNITPGTLTTLQSNAGCGGTFGNGADDWSILCPGSTRASATTCSGALTQPAGVVAMGLVYDSVNHLILGFSGATSGGTVQNETWTYSVPTQAWACKWGAGGGCAHNLTGAPPGVATANAWPGTAFVAPLGVMYYHVATLVGGTDADWVYNEAANTWTQLQTGSGPDYMETMEYDSSANAFVVYNKNTGTGLTDMWIGTLPNISVPLTIQEALPIGLSNCSSAGSCGITRANEVFRTGVPFPDNAVTGFADTSTMTLTTCTAGQFRALATWPSTRVKWVEVLGVLPSLTGGSTATCNLTNGGAGNFGGSVLGTDSNPGQPNVGTITIATGTATYTIKKANFNLIDIATVGATSVITTSSSATRGIVLNGPANPGTTCASSCATVFSSANDSSSTVTIEENGPVETVLKATGALKDSMANVYLRFTAREYFYKNRNGFRVLFSLQNADDGTLGAFQAAYKGFASAYAQLDLASGLGTMQYTFGGRASTIGPTSFSGSETAAIIQYYSNWMEDINYDGIGTWDNGTLPQNSTVTIIPRASGSGCSDNFCYPNSGTGSRVDEGYSIKDGVTSLESGTRAQIPQGWADAANGSGVGMMAGVAYMSAYWPKSVELQNGGNTVAVGMLPASSNITSTLSNFAWWICFACYQYTDMYFEPHAASISGSAGLSNCTVVADCDFKKYQYDLIASAALSEYNNSNVMYWGSLPNATSEDAYLTGMSTTYVGTNSAPNPSVSTGTLCCNVDKPNGNTGPYVLRVWGMNATGGANESDTSQNYLWNFITRGFTAKYVFGRLRERWIEESVFPRSDFAGGWRSKTYLPNVGNMGFPNGVTSTNSTTALQVWNNQQGLVGTQGDSGLHAHFYGTVDWYHSTGEEHYADSIRQGYYDYAINPNVPQGGCSPTTTPSCADLQYPPVPRAVGVKGLFSVYAHDFATETGDSTSATSAWNTAEAVLNKAVRPVMVSPKTSCTNVNCNGAGDYGTDMNRGMMQAMASFQQWGIPGSVAANEAVDGARTSFTFTLTVPSYSGTPAGIFCGADGSSGSPWFPTMVVLSGPIATPLVIATDGGQSAGCPASSSMTLCDRNTSNACLNSTVVSGSAPTNSFGNYTGTASIQYTTAPTIGTAVTAYYWYQSTPSLCNSQSPGCARGAGAFQDSLVVQFLYWYAQQRGVADAKWKGLMDLAYGMSWNYIKSEMTINNDVNWVSGANWSNNGIYFGVIADFCNDPRWPYQSGELLPSTNPSFTPPLPTPLCHAIPSHQAAWSNDSTITTPFGLQETIWWPYMIRNDLYGERVWVADWQSMFYRMVSSGGGPVSVTEYGRPDLSALIYRAQNPALYPALNDIVPAGFSDLGSGNYQLQWIVPTGMVIPAGLSTPYRFKWGALQIVPSMLYDAMETAAYGKSTGTYMPWFAANNVSEPNANTPGTMQAYTFVTGTTGLTRANFSLKAYGAQSQQVFTLGILGGGLVPGKIVF